MSRTSAFRVTSVPDAFVFLLLKEAKELRLKRRGQVADLVEKERPALAGGYAAGIVPDGPGEGPLHVSEELALQKLGGKRRAGDDAERLSRPGAPLMDGPWPGQSCPFRSLRGGGPWPLKRPRDGQGPRPSASGGWSSRDRSRGAPAQIFLQGRDSLLERPHFKYALDRQLDLGGRERFRDVVAGPAPHRLDGRIDGGVSRDDDDLQPGDRGQKRRNEIEPVLGPEPQVHEGKLEGPTGGLGKGVPGTADADDPMALRFEAYGQGPADVGLVVDDENVQRRADRVDLQAPCGINGFNIQE